MSSITSGPVSSFGHARKHEPALARQEMLIPQNLLGAPAFWLGGAASVAAWTLVYVLIRQWAG